MTSRFFGRASPLRESSKLLLELEDAPALLLDDRLAEDVPEKVDVSAYPVL